MPMRLPMQRRPADAAWAGPRTTMPAIRHEGGNRHVSFAGNQMRSGNQEPPHGLMALSRARVKYKIETKIGRSSLTRQNFTNQIQPANPDALIPGHTGI
jgi:hypothetical protein